ncbi:MAG: hypothetical protein GX493_02910, partial [Firmicutes bacterium]|nr:hypothetical protein [Bacillota bacterium]
MLVWYGFAEAENWTADKDLALTIGTFDGVHRGHQAVIATLRRQAMARALSAAAMTFLQHPSAVVGGEHP